MFYTSMKQQIPAKKTCEIVFVESYSRYSDTFDNIYYQKGATEREKMNTGHAGELLL